MPKISMFHSQLYLSIEETSRDGGYAGSFGGNKTRGVVVLVL